MMKPREYSSSRWWLKWMRRRVQINDEGITDSSRFRKSCTLRWADIKTVKRFTFHGHQYVAITPKKLTQGLIVLTEYLDNIGELVSIVKEKAGLMPAFPDLGTFLSAPKTYIYKIRRLSLQSIVLGMIVIFVPGVIVWATYYVCNRLGFRPEHWKQLFDTMWERSSVLIVFGVVVQFGLLTYLGVLVNRLFKLRSTKVIADWDGLSEWRGDCVIKRIGWSELRKVIMLLDRTILTSINGASITVFNHLSCFDEFNQLIWLQKGHLKL